MIYFERRRFYESWTGLDSQTGEELAFPARFTVYHRSLRDYWRAFAKAGFICLDFDEPTIEPPYPSNLEPELVNRYRSCPLSVAFHLQVR